MMFIPTATYRVQLSEAFTLQQLQEVTDYLHQLGITTVYSSPFFEATPGSTHGYDVVNPHRINPEVGTLEEFRSLVDQLKALRMDWLQDIVPNHMAYSTRNPWMYDLLEKGPHSAYYTFFDIDWLDTDPAYYGKVMVPTLGSSLQEVLDNKEIKVELEESGFRVAYFDNYFPINVPSYPTLLSRSMEHLGEQDQGEFQEQLSQVEEYVQNALPNAPDDWSEIKENLLDFISRKPAVQDAVAKTLEEYSQNTDTLQELLDDQYFKLTHWQETEHKINYRRFFTVNDLICLNMQDPKVFQEYHRFIKSLVEQDLIQGVRVDHVDGLFDPVRYLQDLRQLLGPNTYIAVEKILELEETLPDDWPIQGTSGYDFLADVSQLYTDSKQEALLSYYESWANQLPTYEELVYRNKHFILFHRMRGELDNLMALLKKLDIIAEDTALEDDIKLKAALANLLIAFPVYRIYSNGYPFDNAAMEVLAHAFTQAETRSPDLLPYFDALRKVFNGVADEDDTTNRNQLYFVMRCQQFAGPLAAKGVEDTTFYGYNPLISHNEVGDSPGTLGITVANFHRRMQQRPQHTMNATATHDTKRGEDARLRINILSEMPSEWMKETARWQYNNEQYKTFRDENVAWPDNNIEYFIYQTLIGTYPFHVTPEEDNYYTRIQDYLLKGIREAKVMTSWAEPDEAYEQAVLSFTDKILHDDEFIAEFKEFAQEVAQQAVVYSLGQTLLKITTPGIPDVYQGTEFWDLSMVDPDNRRPVNYAQRRDVLSTLTEASDTNREVMLRRLTQDLLDPSIKLFVLHHALKTRQLLPDLFAEGDYEPLSVTGKHQNALMAFRRVWQEQEAVVVVPLRTSSLAEPQLPLGEISWEDTQLTLDSNEEAQWTNVFTQQTFTASASMRVADILSTFPVALLTKHTS